MFSPENLVNRALATESFMKVCLICVSWKYCVFSLILSPQFLSDKWDLISEVIQKKQQQTNKQKNPKFPACTKSSP